MTKSVPDETTLCKFRHLLEANGLNKLFFDAINRVMVHSGHMMKGGTIVDATFACSGNDDPSENSDQVSVKREWNKKEATILANCRFFFAIYDIFDTASKGFESKVKLSTGNETIRIS